MNPLHRTGIYLLFCTFGFLSHSLPALSQNAPPAGARQVSTNRDGQHDFDFQFGTWKVHVPRLLHPLTGSTDWATYDGTHVVQKVWNGRANIGELEIDGTAGHIEGVSLRLYNPESRQWNFSFANSRDGTLGSP